MLVKVCGLTQQSDLDQLQNMGIDLCGFIFHQASPRYIEPEKASKLESGAMKRTGVVVDQRGKELIELINIARLDFVQFHGDQSLSDASLIGREKVIRVLWPDRYATPSDLHRDADEWANYCSFYLLDAGKHGGGSGSTLGWTSLAQLALPRPWFLAGGLSASNIMEALDTCCPQGIDLNSGVETAPGRKNCRQIAQILNNVRQEERL